MKKKIFTLLTLALVSVGATWGETYKHLISSNTEAGYYTNDNTLSHEYDDGVTWSFSAKAGGTATINSSANKYPKFTSESTLTISGISGTVTEIKIWAGLGSSTATIPSSVKVGEESFTTEATSFVYKNDFSAETSYITYTGSGVAGNITITLPTFSSGIYFAGVEITYTSKTISTQAFAGVKEGSTTLTENTDYTVAGNVITLTDVHKATSAPENIKLINHITYKDNSTKDEDVDVTLSKNGDYFEGKATIGATEYTVKVPVDVTPTLNLSASSGSINLKSYEATGTAKVTLTGANLANGTFNAPTASGVTVTPATVAIVNGTINQEFTITSSSTTAPSTVLNFAYTGVTTQSYTLTYSKTAQRSVTQTTVSEATTWDWTKAGGNTIQLTADTDPAKDTDFLMSNIAEITNDANFNSQALVLACEYADRNGYTQAKSVKFTTTVPGTIDVDFSNTGGNRPYRYLYVNGNATEFKSGAATKVSATGIAVPAGEVVLKGYIPNASDPQTREGDNVGDTYLRIYKIVFTPLASGDVVQVTSAGWASFSSSKALDFTGTGVTAYIAKAKDDSNVTLTEISKVPANTGIVVSATAGTYAIPTLIGDADDTTGNLLKPWLTAGTPSESKYYTLAVSGGNPVFKKSSGGTLAAGKSYLVVSGTAAPSLGVDFGSETAGVSEVRSQKEDVRGEYFNLNGQRMAQPTKGLYIVNGKKVVVK